MKGLTLSLVRLAAAAAALLTALCAHCFPLDVKGIDTLNTTIVIRDLRLGMELMNVNSRVPLTPASITKAVTTASMLNIASPEERFETQVIAAGEITDTILYGNVIVRATGDPTIESRFFPERAGFADSIARTLNELGIKRITGRIIIDESEFKDATVPPGWMEEDLLYPYGAVLHGANFRDNRCVLHLPSGTTSPEVPDIKVKFLRAKGRRVKVSREDGTETFVARGPRRAFNESVAVPYPYKMMESEISRRLSDAGISVEGNHIDPKEQQALIYSHRSPSMGRIMQSLMHRSDNMMAEGILRALTPGGTRREALEEQRQIWAEMGLLPYKVNVVDGSGLSRSNRLTGKFMTTLLTTMSFGENAPAYTSLFPRAGYDGTLRNFLLDTPLEGRVALKTGSMKGVQSYAGYIFDEFTGKPTHSIVMIANNFRCSRAALKVAFQRLLLKIFAPETTKITTEETEEENYDTGLSSTD